MKAAELRAMSDDELSEELEDMRKEMFNLRFQKTTGRLETTSRVALLKRDIARVLTIQRERELWTEYEAALAAHEKE